MPLCARVDLEVMLSGRGGSLVGRLAAFYLRWTGGFDGVCRGRVFDGTGSKVRAADLLIEDGLIVGVGEGPCW